MTCLPGVLAVLSPAVPALGQTYSDVTIHSFIPAPFGKNPYTSLIQASDGNLYGTTSGGGMSNGGTVFKISNLVGTPSETVLYSFTGGADGAGPNSSLVQAADGNLYGTTLGGGTSHSGTVFKIGDLGGAPTLTVIHAFAGEADGAAPVASLIQASDGDLYGTTTGGGTSGSGTVFRIASPGSIPVESVIYSFTGGADGGYPYAGLVEGSDGNLYGTTIQGGASDAGTVFEISGLGGTPAESVIYSFAAGADGSYPNASVIQASDGNLYGTTFQGGASNYGTVFRIGNLAGTPTETVLYGFVGAADGINPVASLIQAADGNLYGTTLYGGSGGYGTVFAIGNLAGTPTESIVYSFTSGTDGAYPFGSLMQASDGNLYGTTDLGGASNIGTVFEVVNPSGSPGEGVLYSFAFLDGGNSYSSLMQASDGNLYGTTYYGGPSDYGTVFRIRNIAGLPTLSYVHGFSGGADGGYPSAALIQASDGNLYGTTYAGGANSAGTVYELGNLAGIPTFSVIHSFAGGAADGSNPRASVLQATDGDLYGTTFGGGTYGVGTVFRISNLSGSPAESVIYNFTEGIDGASPYASLIQASDGNLYGTASIGGASNAGTVYEIGNLGGTPSFNVIYTFSGGNDGGAPFASLIEASDGNLYGTAFSGGDFNSGAIFEIGNLAGSPTESVVYSFTGGADGRYPAASLIQASDGNLYGTTTTGGSSGYGTVFSITNPSGAPTQSVIYSFTGGADGNYPLASLLEASDENLYGTTYQGGTAGYGVVFALVKPCFADVPAANPFRSFICTIARDGITAGCGAGNFCPADSVLRSQMAAFLLRGEHGSAYVPPPAVGLFADVPASDPFAPWIEELYNEGITAGCGTNPLIYCPSDSVTRSSMAVLLLRAQNGSAYTPPACAGIFADVTCPGPFTDWIEALYGAGITGGCGANPLTYCPGDPVTRAQMAVFLVATFNLQ